MNLPEISDLEISRKKVLLRLDLDVPVRDGQLVDDTRLQFALPTINNLLERGCAVLIIGHRGRPEGKINGRFSLEPISKTLASLLSKKIEFVFDLVGEEAKDASEKISPGEIILLENLRFDKREEENDLTFAKSLASFGDFYVNDAFAASHRENASIVGLPRLLPHAAGFHLAKEVEVLSGILENPQKPVVIVVGGGKPEKANLIDDLAKNCDLLLIAGVLPKQEKTWPQNSKVARLLPHGNDISPDSLAEFSSLIKSAGTLVWNGPLGDIDRDFEEGTRKFAEVFAQSQAYKVVGGGDTVAFLKKLRLSVKMDWISTGGGAMLEFLAYGDLPGLEALRK